MLKITQWVFPGRPEVKVKTPCSQCVGRGGPGLIPGQGIRSHTLQTKKNPACYN